MLRRTLAIARYTTIEAFSTRFSWICLCIFLILFAGSFFISQIVLIEASRFQVAFLAVGMRLSSVLLLSLFILSSQSREFNDKGTEIILSLDLTRAAFIIGKFFGFAIIAFGLAVAVFLSLGALAPLDILVLWSISFILELWIIVALCIFAIFAFNQVLPAACFVIAFYLLSRSIYTIQLISGTSGPDMNGTISWILSRLIDLLALFFPRLDLFTRTEWLVNHIPDWYALGSVAVQSIIYTVLLLCAAMFDTYRKNF